MGKPQPLFDLFSSFSQHNDKHSKLIDNKSINAVLRIQTRDSKMVGTEL